MASNSKTGIYEIGNEVGTWRPLHLRTEEDLSTEGLNLGCGKRLLPDCINHDVRRVEGVDVVWDLNHLPWPWPDNRFKYVSAWAVLEHLDIDLLTAMNEIWRILDGRLDVKLPYWENEISYSDPTHRYVCSLDIFDTFDPETERGQKYDFYTDRKWHIISKGFCNDRQSSIQAHMETIK